jgi:hypothetical protein
MKYPGGSVTSRSNFARTSSTKLPEIASAHVGHDDGPPLTLFALDLFWPSRDADAGDLVERDVFAARRAKQDAAHGIGIGPIPVRQPQRHGVALLPLDDFGHQLA